MNSIKTKTPGFTIVELLIVIIVIGILAAITLVSYNGIQNKAANAKTVSAVSAWAKAIRMYYDDNGSWPTTNSCLGSVAAYADSYSGRCWAPDTSGWVVNSTFMSQVQPYLGGSTPDPSTKNIDTDANQYRGAMYFTVSATDKRIYAEFIGVNTCPMITGLGDAFGGANRTNGRSCYYYLQQP